MESGRARLGIKLTVLVNGFIPPVFTENPLCTRQVLGIDYTARTKQTRIPVAVKDDDPYLNPVTATGS